MIRIGGALLVLAVSFWLGHLLSQNHYSNVSKVRLTLASNQGIYDTHCSKVSAVAFDIQAELRDNYLASCIDLVTLQAMEKVKTAEEKNRVFLNIKVKQGTWEKEQAEKFCWDLFHQHNGYPYLLGRANKTLDNFGINCEYLKDELVRLKKKLNREE